MIRQDMAIEREIAPANIRYCAALIPFQYKSQCWKYLKYFFFELYILAFVCPYSLGNINIYKMKVACRLAWTYGLKFMHEFTKLFGIQKLSMELIHTNV